MKTYLENVLATLTENADVKVKLNSVTVYEDGFEMVDGCGNHYTRNWMSAIKERNLYAKLVVKNVSVEPMYGEPGRVQWVIDLTNTRFDECANELRYYSNQCAVAEIWEV